MKPLRERLHLMAKHEIDLSGLSQVGREAVERGDNPRSLSDTDYAAYLAAVEESGAPDPSATPEGSNGEDA